MSGHAPDELGVGRLVVDCRNLGRIHVSLVLYTCFAALDEATSRGVPAKRPCHPEGDVFRKSVE
jgi:hypothetical protein